MSDIALRWAVVAGDVAIEGDDLARDDGLETAVILSLFTDRRADDSDPLPDGHTDRRGWWGDDRPAVAGDRIGSRLWLLARETQRAQVLGRAEAYVREALAWLLTDQVAAAVDVTVEFTRPGWLGIAVAIRRPLGPPVDFRFTYLWIAQEARA
jgi:phage gp46-like protein